MNAPRYIVEAKDEYGWIDYDRFNTSDDAVALAKALSSDGWEVVVVDAREMLRVWEG